MNDDETTIHSAGPAIQYGTTIRQRCMWCGLALVSQDLSIVAVAQSDSDRCDVCGGRRNDHIRTHEFVSSPPPFPTWQPGAFIAQGGGVSYEVLNAEKANTVKAEDLAVKNKLPVCLLLPNDWTE